MSIHLVNMKIDESIEKKDHFRRIRFMKTMTSTVSVILLLLPYILLISTGETSGVYGIVKDIDGNPLSDVNVTIMDTSGSFIASTRTLLGGDFSIDLDRGTYKVLIEKEGYETKSITLTVTKAYVPVNLGVITLNYGLRISVSQTSLRVKCLSEIVIPFTIMNKGSDEEKIRINIEAPEGWDAGAYSGTAQVEELTLGLNEAQSLSLKVWIPYCPSGTYKVTVKASGRTTTQEGSLSFYVESVDPQLITTKYPIARTAPGARVNFDLTIKNTLTRRFTGYISLQYPEGWSAALIREDGGDLYGLTLDPGDFVRAKLELDVPTNAGAGDYDVNVGLKTQDLESSLQLKVAVVVGVPKLRLRTETPYVDAYAGSSANYRISAENIGDSDGIVNFSVEELPAGYNWMIKDATGSVVSKLYLKAGEGKTLTMVVNVPPLAEPDLKSFKLNANVGKESSQLTFGLGILGWYSIGFVTENFYVESFAGESTTFQISIQNKGHSSLTNVKIDLIQIPSKFNVKIEPSVILLLKPQETTTFYLTISTDADISAGDYYVTIDLKADQTEVPVRDVHVYVKQRGEVVYIGAGIVIAVIGSLFLIYRRYGRR